MFINKIQQNCIHSFLINRLVNYLIFQLKILFLKTFDSEFSYIEVWFTGQNSQLLEIEYKKNITLLIN